MSSRASASRYARALFEVTDPSVRSRVDEELTGTAQLLTNQPDLQSAFASPSVPATAKRGIVQALVAQAGVAEPVAKLLLLLADRDRLALIPDVAAVFHERMLEEQHVLLAQVTTAEPLDDAQRDALQARLSAATAKQVRITPHVDPAIIGGMVARIGSTVYDASLAHQLARVRARLTAQR